MIPDVGTRMLRLEDGRQGQVELASLPGSNGPLEKRIVYYDRGDRIVASKLERWVVDAPPAKGLRSEEIQQVARNADRVLRALERHEPFRWWEEPNLDATPHDPELVALITEYLTKRA